MAASFNESQKIDYLWKKVGYGVTKTAEPASKEAFNESIASPLLYRGDLIWTQSGDIPASPPANTTALVQVYKDGGGAGYSPAVQCTEDLTAPDNQTWKTNSTNWIPTQFGDNYLVQVYAGAANISNPQTAGTKLFGAGSGSDDTWFFDYQSGVLNFNGATIPTAIGTGTANVIYIVGYRYVGEFGVDTTFISNGTSNVTIATANANITMGVNGTGNVIVVANTGAYITGAMSASGNITGGNILSNNYYYANGTPVPPGIIYTANTAPPVSPAPKVTDQWYNTSTDVLYQYLDDGTSDYWVDISSPAFAGGVVANVSISGNLLVNANAVYDIGSSSQTFSNVYAQNYFGNGASLSGIITSVGNINNGTSNVTVVSSGGNITHSVAGTSNVGVWYNAGLSITGDLTVTGNATLTGNILGDRIQNGTSLIDIQSASGNANISIGGTSNVAVFATTGAYITGLISATGAITGAAITGSSITVSTGNITGGNLILSGAITDSGQLDISTTASNGNIVLTPNGTGNVNISSNIMPTSSNASANIGSATTYFNTIFGKATTAQYADLAENYLADADYAPGTVLDFDGTQEVTISTRDSSKRVAGVVSTNPAHLMNSTLDGAHVTAVALAGRVPTQVTGTIAKGDLMVSAGNGRARAEANPSTGTVIGKSLENFNGGEGTIEIVISMQ